MDFLNLNHDLSILTSDYSSIMTSLQQVEESFFEGKIPSPPIFIITYGPPGSGKTDIVNDICKKFGITKNRLVNVLVDEVVEKLPGYLNEMKAVAADKGLSDDEKQAELTKVYFKYRRENGDYLSENILHRAFVGKYNVVWETTGDSIDWALKTIQDARQEGYMILLVYPYVSEEKLLDRVKKRAQSGSNPRKPDSERVKKNILSAQRNFKKLSKYVDAAFVYDNNGTPQELGLFFEMEKTYRGWCSREDKNCKRGIVTNAKCDIKRIKSNRREFEPSFGSYIDGLCDQKP